MVVPQGTWRFPWDEDMNSLKHPNRSVISWRVDQTSKEVPTLDQKYVYKNYDIYITILWKCPFELLRNKQDHGHVNDTPDCAQSYRYAVLQTSEVTKYADHDG